MGGKQNMAHVEGGMKIKEMPKKRWTNKNKPESNYLH